jgi:hypothetical protein
MDDKYSAQGWVHSASSQACRRLSRGQSEQLRFHRLERLFGGQPLGFQRLQP